MALEDLRMAFEGGMHIMNAASICCTIALSLVVAQVSPLSVKPVHYEILTNAIDLAGDGAGDGAGTGDGAGAGAGAGIGARAGAGAGARNS